MKTRTKWYLVTGFVLACAGSFVVGYEVGERRTMREVERSIEHGVYKLFGQEPPSESASR